MDFEELELDEPRQIGSEIPLNHFDVDLECSKEVVRLEKSEWKMLQRFLKNYDFDGKKIEREDYSHLPFRVRRVLADWRMAQKQTSKKPPRLRRKR